MSDAKDTIGLPELLDEVSHDLDEFRKKHASDYTVKNITLWWELERDRVLARHVPATTLRKLRRVQSVRRMLLLFTAGWLTMAIIETVVRLLVR